MPGYKGTHTASPKGTFMITSVRLANVQVPAVLRQSHPRQITNSRSCCFTKCNPTDAPAAIKAGTPAVHQPSQRQAARTYNEQKNKNKRPL